MRERKKKGNDRSEDRRSPEGVRIIRADEAQAALDTGQAAGRRPEDELRFGDVPPAPEGPRSPHRFPLPDTVDPAAAVPRRPLAPPRRSREDRPVERRTRRIDPDAAHDPRPWDERVPLTAMPTDAQPTAPEPGEPTEGHQPSAAEPSWPGPQEQPEYDPTAYQGAAYEGHAGSPQASDPQTYDPQTYDPQTYGQPQAYDPQTYDPQTYGQPQAYDPQTYDPQTYGQPQPYDPQTYDPQTYGQPQTYDPQTYDPQTYQPPGHEPEAYDPAGSPPSPPAPAGQPGWEPSAAWRAWQEPDDTGGDMEAVWPSSPEDPQFEPWPREQVPAGVDQPGVHPVAEVEAAGDIEAAGHVEAVGNVEAAGNVEAVAAEEHTQVMSSTEWAATPGEDHEVVASPEIEGASMPASPDESDDLEPPPEGGDATVDPPSLGLSVAPGSAEMPHWTDPPTGDVPRIVADAGSGETDDLNAWRALGANATRWRGDGDWDEDVDLGDLASAESQVGAMDMSRSEQSDLYSFDKEFDALEEERSGAHRVVSLDDAEDFEDFEDLEPEPQIPEPISVGSGRSSRTEAAAGPGRTGPAATRVGRGGGGGGGGSSGGSGSSPASGSAQRDLGQAVVVGIGLVILLFIAYAIGSIALLILATAVVVACAVEGYGMLQRAGFRPATLLGLVATAGVMFAAYWRGPTALPLIAAIMFVASMLWYLLQIVEARPLANVAVTTMIWLWVGLLGSFAALMLQAKNGRGLFLGAVIPVIVADIVAYGVGRQIGHRPLAPHISPGKTIEGLIAGGLAAIVAGVIVGKEITPWGGAAHGLLLGLAIAILAPIGDLFESMIKRDLMIKDSGSMLPGHGGLLDRFDSILLVLPAAFYLATYFGIVVR